MRSIRAYDVAPGHEVADFPGGFVEKTIIRDDLVKIIFTNGTSMLTWDDSLIRVNTDSD